MKWDKYEKMYAAFMYVTEALAVLSFIAMAFHPDLIMSIKFGIAAVILTIVSATFHVLLLVYSRTKVIAVCGEADEADR